MAHCIWNRCWGRAGQLLINVFSPVPCNSPRSFCMSYLVIVIAKFLVSRCAFCRRLSGPLRKHMFTCDWCISIHFVCFCVSVACNRPVPGNSRLVFFKDERWSTQKTFRRVCMEFSKHHWATISETICPEMLIFGK